MQKSTYRTWSEPINQAAKSVVAGEGIEISYSFSNDEAKPLVLTAEIEGLPGAWLPQNPVKAAIAPFDQGSVSILILPPDTVAGDVTFTLAITGGWDSPRTLTLQVTPSPNPTPVSPKVEVVDVAPVSEEPVPVGEEKPTTKPTAPVMEQAADPEPVTPTVEPETVVVPVPASEPPKVVDLAPPTPEPTPEPVPVPTPEPPKAEPKIVDFVAPAPEPEPVIEKPEEPKQIKQGIKAAPRPRAVTPEPPAATPEAEPEPPVVSEPKIVDYEPVVLSETAPEESALPSFDRVVVDPKDGAIIQARPGDRVLVKLTFTNELQKGALSGTRTFIIQDDRSLQRDWVSLIQDQVNVTPGGSGEVSLLLTPPLSADPSSYPFALQSGPLGQALTPCNLVLEVQPMPAVALTVTKPVVSVWLKRDISFDLSVATAGNADTAYRLGVRAPNEGNDEVELGKLPDELVETNTWRYLIERQVGNLASPVTGRAPAPEPHKMTLRRKGHWWFGFRESHRATVAAVPVTDAANGAKGNNVIEVTAVRLRPWPIPLVILLPLLFVLFFIFGSGGSDLRVANQVAELDGVSYVLGTDYQTVQKAGYLTVNLDWKNGTFPTAPMRADKDAKGETTATVKVNSKSDRVELGSGYTKSLEYTLSGGLLGGSERKAVTVLGLRTKDKLLVNLADANGQWIEDDPKQGIQEDSFGGAIRKVKVINIDVPVGGKPRTLGIGNTAEMAEGYSVHLVEIHPADKEKFQITGFSQSGDHKVELRAHSAIPVKISSTAKVGDTDTWELITTDSSYPILRFKLKAVNP